ncbi:MAG: ABC transporter substrate-binding protein, partial [Actinobacteria bacterium]|nr:ABC transporter substrate-binding protein [Actinomycetota bacterium]
MVVVIAVVSLVFAACGKDNNKSSSATTAKPTNKGSLTIALTDFPEQDIVANIYAEALRAKGYTVTVKPGLSTREILQPALQSGQVDVAAEYVGSWLEYLQKGSATSDLDASLTKLRGLVKDKGLTVLDAADAYDANAIVVTKATADKYKLTKISDLKTVASQLTFGATPECEQRPLCLIGLKEKYGIAGFKKVEPIAKEPLRKQALTDGNVQVALLFSSSLPDGAVALDDDQHLQPAENLVPVVRT